MCPFKHHDRRKVLIVDDSPDIHRDFANILESSEPTEALDRMETQLFGDTNNFHQKTDLHYRLFYTTQGKEALEMVRNATACADPFLVAFVDMRMPPGWDGIETIERLWQEDPQLQVVLCTAYSDYSWQEIQHRLGPTSNLLILKKPFDVSEVAQMAAALTEKWRLFQKAAAKQETLTFMVEERTRELTESNRRLQEEIKERKRLEIKLFRSQKMEAIGTLAAGVAHDLNNILSGIVTYPDLLLMGVAQADPMYENLKMIQRSGEKAAAIVQDMLTLGRRGVIDNNPLDLATIIEEYMQSPGHMALKGHFTNVRIETRFTIDQGFIQGSESQLSKCLVNLVENAADSLFDGGVVTIGLSRRDLDSPHDGYVPIPPGKYVVLSVIDTGTGINEVDLEHIFEPFYTKKKMGRSGTGLGLAIVWGVVRDHKGFVDVISHENHGTRFDLYFPFGEKRQVSRPSSTTEADGEKEFILVVDDVEEQREVAVALLEAVGYRAEAVPSGEAAIRFIRKHPVDLMLLDMIMDPGIDGLETFTRVRSINPDQRAIVASGYTKSDRVEKILAMGACSFLSKPYRLELLAKSVKEALKPVSR